MIYFKKAVNSASPMHSMRALPIAGGPVRSVAAQRHTSVPPAAAAAHVTPQ
jgi:hypothetical protein